MRRKLGRFELAETLSDEYFPFNVVGILFLAEGPSQEILRKTLDALQQRHPLLRVKIEKKERQYFYESQDVPQIPLEILSRESEDHWKKITEENLNQRLNTGSGPLIQCTYLVGQTLTSESELIITCHHSIIDATSFNSILHEILSLSAAFDTGAPIKDYSPLPIYPPEERFFPPAYKGLSRRWRSLKFMGQQIRDEISYRKGVKGKRQAPLHLSGQCRILPLETSVQTTQKIIQSSRKHRITVNSILTAAMLLAVNEILYNGEDLPLRYFTFADLRPYLKPPISKENLGTFHSMLRLTIPIKKDHDFWELADRINIQILKSFKRGDKFISALLTPPMMRMIIRLKNMRMGTSALSYPRVVHLDSSYGKSQVLGIRGYISNFPLGPEYSAVARMYGEKLLWDILYLDSDMDQALAKKIAEKMFSILDDAG